MSRNRIALLALCLASTAASAQSGHFGTFDPRSGRFAAAFAAEPARAADTLALSAPAAWVAISRAYERLGIPLTVVDSESHVIGALRATQRRAIAGERLSRLLDCGLGSYGPNADRYTVQLTALSGVQALSDGRSVVETRVSGIASPNGLSSSVNCASTGALEDRVSTELRAARTP